MTTRKEFIVELEKLRGSRVICYFTGDRPGQETQIGDDVLPWISNHLSKIGCVDQLDILLNSRGGNTLTGFALANGLREFAKHVTVLVPFRAQSCATLIALGADEIIMGPFGQLSPIDPSIHTPHGPTIEREGTLQFIPVSVEDVANYIQLARKEVGLATEEQMAEVLAHLCQRVSPLALGAVYRAREQIGMLASKLLSLHIKDEDRIKRIVKQLTRELLSHDYIINRREAREIGLPVLDAEQRTSEIMWAIYEDIAAELNLGQPWNAEKELKGAQSVKVTNKRGVLESRDLLHVFESTYQIKRVTMTKEGNKFEALQVTPLDEGWKMM